MVNITIKIDADSNSSHLRSIKAGIDEERLDQGSTYANLVPISLANYVNVSPIKEVKAEQVQNDDAATIPPDRYKKLKPLWLFAEIKPEHIDQGEKTDKQKSLRNIIRARGTTIDGVPDDCGHIIASSLGGKMVDLNLFPQNRDLNRGHNGNFSIWRRVEALVQLWVTGLQKKHEPRVEFQMLLYYENDGPHRDRPNKFDYHIVFLHTGKEDGKISLSNLVFNIGQIALQSIDEGKIVQIKSIIEEQAQKDKAEYNTNYKCQVEKFMEVLNEITAESKQSSSGNFTPRAAVTVH